MICLDRPQIRGWWWCSSLRILFFEKKEKGNMFLPILFQRGWTANIVYQINVKSFWNELYTAGNFTKNMAIYDLLLKSSHFGLKNGNRTGTVLRFIGAHCYLGWSAGRQRKRQVEEAVGSWQFPEDMAMRPKQQHRNHPAILESANRLFWLLGFCYQGTHMSRSNQIKPAL